MSYIEQASDIRPRASKLLTLTIAVSMLFVICLATFAVCDSFAFAAEPSASKAKKPVAPAGEKSDNDPADEREPRTAADNPFPKRFKAPDLDGGTGWLNTSGEITLKDLRGKIV